MLLITKGKLDNRDENKSGESNITKEFDRILKDTKNKVWVDKPLIN